MRPNPSASKPGKVGEGTFWVVAAFAVPTRPWRLAAVRARDGGARVPFSSHSSTPSTRERWAERALEEGEAPAAQRIESLYLEAFSRTPTTAETECLLTYLDGRDDEDAWADVCHVLFNVKEFIFLN